MSLLDLPTELLDNIITLTFRHGGFKSIVQAFKTTHNVGESYIPRYNALTRKWRTVCISDRSSDVRATLDVIRAILENPDIAWFIESIDLRGGKDLYGNIGEVIEDMGEDELGMLRRSMETSRYLTLAGQDVDHWIASMGLRASDRSNYDDEPYRVLFRVTYLLSLLPNLKELTLTDHWACFKDVSSSCGEVLNTIVALSHSELARNNNAPDDLPLGKLQRLRPFQLAEYDPMPRSGVAIIAPFLALPSLWDLHSTNLIAVDDRHTGIPFTWPYPDTNSNVRNIDLDGCCINADGISELLKHTPYVKTLRYSHSTKWHGCQHDWDAGAFVNTVAEHCGHILTELCVTTDSLFGEVETGIVLLKTFEKLEKVTLDVREFCAPPPDSGSKLGMVGPYPKNWTLQDIPHISKIFPTSVRYVQLISRGDKKGREVTALRKLLGGSEQLTASHTFPRLERLVVRYRENPDDSTGWGQHPVATEKEKGSHEAELPSIRAVLEAAGAKLLRLE